MMEKVILVNEKDEALGSMEKMAAHEQAVLHRAFSIFIFNDANEMLLQQRSVQKYHSGGLWTNACCSHPRPGESTLSAAQRRLKEELGFDTTITKKFHFTYRADLENGLTEYEFDHVFTGLYNGLIYPNSEEVQAWRYISKSDLEMEINTQPGSFTPWFHIAYPKIAEGWKASAFVFPR